MKEEPLESGSFDDTSIIVDEQDRDAARRALARNWPDLEQTSPEYAALLKPLAKFHRLCGTDSFELRFDLRAPKNRTEVHEQQFMHGRITEAELQASLKADAERPIDLEMLTSFCDAYEDNLQHYSGVLQKSVFKPSEAGTSARRTKERAIDDHIAVLRGKLPLWRENLETVFDFLEELRVTSGAGLLKLGDYEATSAHWLAQLIFTRTTEAWRSCREVSARSHSDPRYLYAAEAIDLFYEQWFPRFPSPQSIGERLREEFVLARSVLRRAKLSGPINSGATMDLVVDALDHAQKVDNESRELVLVGQMFSLVGNAGHIFRPTPNSDWGIDGEIEFKDEIGRASGRRVYVQLKSGDSYLVPRKGDGKEIFTVKNIRHLEYWAQQAYPVMLVIRQSSGVVRWMNVSDYLKQNGQQNRQIVFCGETLTVASIHSLAQKLNAVPGDAGRK